MNHTETEELINSLVNIKWELINKLEDSADHIELQNQTIQRLTEELEFYKNYAAMVNTEVQRCHTILTNINKEINN